MLQYPGTGLRGVIRGRHAKTLWLNGFWGRKRRCGEEGRGGDASGGWWFMRGRLHFPESSDRGMGDLRTGVEE